MPRRRTIRRLSDPQPPGGRLYWALRQLRQAHRLMDVGEYAQAYPILKRLADGAAERGMPVRAANLYLQAGHARLEMGSAQDAVVLSRRAIRLLIDAGQAERVGVLLPRIVELLTARGYHDEAVNLRAEVSALSGGLRSSVGQHDEGLVRQRGVLPAKCPSCAAPVRPDEVTWIDDRTAECVYCGSTLQAER
jgi:hypothetical protein